MIEIQGWMNQFLKVLEKNFAGRIWFVGLQGSYGRGEATEQSDIDTVVILDQLNAADLKVYRDMIDTLPHRELICGFLSGKEEILHWDPAELFQFYYDTTPIQGTLDALLSRIDAAAVERAIHSGACQIYHGCVHNMLYGKSDAVLRELYKSASFVVQAIAFRTVGKYIKFQKDLQKVITGRDAAVVSVFRKLKNSGAVEFAAMSETLLEWAEGLIVSSQF